MHFFSKVLLSAAILLTTTALAKESAPPPAATATLRAIRYDARLNDAEARFVAELEIESIGRGEVSLPLFSGDIAVLPTVKLPTGLWLAREGSQYRLTISRPGTHKIKLEVIAKITRTKPWNHVTFVGPPAAAIAAIVAESHGAGMEIQLLNGTVIATESTDAIARLRGLLGADQTVSLRWRSKAAEAARKPVVTCATTATAQITPSVVKFATTLRFEVLQGNVGTLTVALPAAQALTRVEGAQIRDWQLKTDGSRQILSVELVKPIEKTYTLTLYSEQTVDATPFAAQLVPPQPLDTARETGALTLAAEDVLVEMGAVEGLRQINAPPNALAAYRFDGRPATLQATLRRIEPVINVTTRATARLEESRLLALHTISLTVEKAGIYSLELAPLGNFVVADVRGDGVEDWKARDGKLHVTFRNRVLGNYRLDVQLEQSLKAFPEKIALAPLRVAGATKETGQVGAAAIAGIRLKTAELVGLREIPATNLESRTDEALGYNIEQPDWSLTLAAEKLPSRIHADIFNLITLGDGIVQGSAMIRYAVLNQGVQELNLKLPAHWKNVDFTGPNLRRKDKQGDTWIIGLQDKIWGGYTLVVTYDFPFDPKQATLGLGGIHALGVERETGWVAVTSAANVQLREKTATDALHRVDEDELAAADRALITRPVLLAYQYTGDKYELALDVTRFEELPVLQAVADRTQLTTVLTDEGQMLTQATFMVKNNDRQFLRFTLPTGANFWGCYVSGQAVKPEKQGDEVLVPLRRGANRDEAYPVEIVYAQKIGSLKSALPRTVKLQAPLSDMQTTYAEWELWVPATHALANFGGNMTVAPGTTYGLRDAWKRFIAIYNELFLTAESVIWTLTAFFFALVLVVLVVLALLRRSRSVALTTLGIIVLLVIVAGMMLPTLGRSRRLSQGRASLAHSYRAEAANEFEISGEGIPNSQMPQEMYKRDLSGLTEEQIRNETDYLRSGQGYFNTGSLTVNGTLVNSGRIVAVNGSAVTLVRSGTIGIGNEAVGRFDNVNGTWSSRGNVNAASGLVVDGRTAPAFSNAIAGLGGGSITVNSGGQFAAITPSTPPAAPMGTVPVAGMAGASGMAPMPTAVMPAVAGILPIRIDIPKTGTRFVFTKVLNIENKPLSVRARAIKTGVLTATRSGLELAAFLVGLILVWRQLKRPQANSFWVAVGAALALGSVADLLVAARLLHVVFVVTPPLVIMFGFGWLVARWWRQRRARGTGREGTAAPVPAPVPPVITLLLSFVLAGLCAGPATAQSGGVSILSAKYDGVVRDQVARIEAVVAVSTTEPNQKVPLFGKEVAVEQFSASPSGAKLVRDGGIVSVLVPKRGATTLRVKFVTKVGGDVDKRFFSFAITPALTSQLALTIDEPEAAVEVPAAVMLKTTQIKAEAVRGAEAAPTFTRVEAVIGAGERVEVRWTPRVKRAAEIAATVFCQNTALVSVGNGVINTTAALEYQVSQGELRQARVRLPAAHRLMRVDGEFIRTWNVAEEGGAQTLTVELVKGVTPSYRLTVETEQVLPMAERGRDTEVAPTLSVQIPHALDVKRETGWIGLRASEELSLSVENAAALQKVDVEEFGRTALQAGRPVLPIANAAYRFLKPEFQLAVRVETVKPELEAEVRTRLQVGAEQIALFTHVDYNIKRAGVFVLQLVLPAGYQVDEVAGSRIGQWVEKSETGERLLEVMLKARTQGNCRLHITMHKSVRELPKTIEVATAYPLGTQKLTGFVSVLTDAGIQAKTESFEGLTEIPSTEAGEPSGALAFKFITSEPTARAPWKLAVSTEALEPWVRAEIVNWITLSETLVSGRSLVRFEIQNAPTKVFRVRVPAAFKNVEVNGANIRRRDQKDNEWRVELQSKTMGVYLLTVTWDRARDAKDTVLELAGVEALDVERETGALAVVAPPQLEVKPKNLTDELLAVDRGDLPEWAGRAADTTALAYKYLRPGYRLTLDIHRFEEAQVLQALVDAVQLKTVVADDGQMMTEITLAVRNNARQHLAITLPPKAQVWSAFVGGLPVRPSVRDGKVLVPLERTSATDAPVSVQLTYISAERFPATRGRVELASPALDLPLKNARWSLYLPPDYRYGKFKGSMVHEVVSAAPVYRSFTWSEYTKVEGKKKAERELSVVSQLNVAQGYLSKGDVARANRALKEAKETDKDVVSNFGTFKALEQSVALNNAGSIVENSGLMAQRAQQAMGGEQFIVQAPPPHLKPTQIDLEAAAQQWVKLQATQEIATGKSQPLRVNLPTRGISHAFTQVLQTEVGQPMTIRFNAVNTKTTGWPWRVAGSIAGFVVLWLLAGWALSRRQHVTA